MTGKVTKTLKPAAQPATAPRAGTGSSADPPAKPRKRTRSAGSDQAFAGATRVDAPAAKPRTGSTRLTRTSSTSSPVDAVRELEAARERRRDAPEGKPRDLASAALRDAEGRILELNRADDLEQRATDKVDAAREFFGELGVDLSDVGVRVRTDTMGSSSYRRGTDTITVRDSLFTGLHDAYADDVIAHEMAHAAIGRFVDLDTARPETAAISESLADTFAVAMDRGDWTIGEYGTSVAPVRDMAGEGGTPERQTSSSAPDHVREYDPLGEGHAQSGIPSRAAYVIGTRLGRDAMASIYMDAVRDIDEDVTFAELAHETVEAARDLYGDDSRQARVVHDAWTSIGLTESQIRDPEPLAGGNQDPD